MTCDYPSPTIQAVRIAEGLGLYEDAQALAQEIIPDDLPFRIDTEILQLRKLDLLVNQILMKQKAEAENPPDGGVAE